MPSPDQLHPRHNLSHDLPTDATVTEVAKSLTAAKSVTVAVPPGEPRTRWVARLRRAGLEYAVIRGGLRVTLPTDLAAESADTLRGLARRKAAAQRLEPTETGARDPWAEGVERC